jgi:hypothetical protein
VYIKPALSCLCTDTHVLDADYEQWHTVGEVGSTTDGAGKMRSSRGMPADSDYDAIATLWYSDESWAKAQDKASSAEMKEGLLMIAQDELNFIDSSRSEFVCVSCVRVCVCVCVCWCVVYIGRASPLCVMSTRRTSTFVMRAKFGAGQFAGAFMFVCLCLCACILMWVCVCACVMYAGTHPRDLPDRLQLTVFVVVRSDGT